ncbi:hypothetical protein [Desulfovirgula thermocuniculi]|uniref:hypothetical protein n=1 Tax=Desulfovirgula thermocuniculi TaxID=348842 RepID=UPI000422D7FA|nr:hypothetical protein [Desulfovirgula thermocuniculi]
MNLVSVAGEALAGALRTVLFMAAILFPLMVLLEALRRVPLWKRWTEKGGRYLRWLGLSEASAFPLLAGLFFGLLYGAGVIIEELRGARLHRREVWLLNLFLGMSHAVVEDTAIFLALGANLWVILGGRLILTLAVIGLLAAVVRKIAAKLVMQ